MRTLLPLLLLAGAALTAWLLLGGEPDAPAQPASPPERRGDAGAAAPAPSVLVRERPRVGVLQGDERSLAADPDAPPWPSHVLRLRAGPKGRVTGAGLLEALGERLYVRARTLEELDAFRRAELPVEPGVEIPVSALRPIFEQAGFRMEVRDPVLLLRPLTEQERAERAAADPERDAR